MCCWASSPGGRAFFQEGVEPLLAFRADADAGDGVFGVAAQVGAECATGHFTQQVLAGLHGLRAVEQQVADPSFDLGVQFGGRVGLGQQAQFAGAVTCETLGGQRIAACGALTEGLDHEGADHRRCQADAHFGQAEQRVVRTDGHIAAADQAHRAAEGRALNHGQGRDLQGVEVVHQLGQLAGIIQVGVVIELGRSLHPGQVGTGGEVPAAPAQQQEAQGLVGGDRVDGEDQLADHLGVEGVVLLRTVQP